MRARGAVAVQELRARRDRLPAAAVAGAQAGSAGGARRRRAAAVGADGAGGRGGNAAPDRRRRRGGGARRDARRSRAGVRLHDRRYTSGAIMRSPATGDDAPVPPHIQGVRKRTARVVALLWLLAAGCQTAPAGPAAPQPPNGEVWLTDQQVTDGHIAVQPVGVHAVGNDVVTSGKVTFDDLRVAHIFSPVTGRVSRILADPGAAGEEGGARSSPSSRPTSATPSPISARPQAELIAAEHDFQRQKELYEAHAGSQKDFEAAAGQLRQGQGRAGARAAEGAPVPRRRRRRGHAGVHAARADRRRGDRPQREPRRRGAGAVLGRHRRSSSSPSASSIASG